MKAPELPYHYGAIGVDEAGRGPLAGPVVAAAVRFPEGLTVKGLNDSKKLDAAKRERLAAEIAEVADYAIAFVWPEEIDSLNILWASMKAMEDAVFDIKPRSTRVLIDGNRVPRRLVRVGEAIIKGDAKVAEIAAASILAKTARDAYMVNIHREYPDYGFDRHFGYPSPDHLEALRVHGPTPIHRRSYAPVREAYERLEAVAEPVREEGQTIEEGQWSLNIDVR